MKKSDSKKIKCPIFRARNETIEKIGKAINKADGIREKAVLAKNLLREVESLLSCPYVNRKKAECKICQYVAKLRRRTANFILKTKNLRT